MQVVDVNLVRDCPESEIVELAERHSPAHASASQPSAKAVWVMPSPVRVPIAGAVLQVLVVRRAPELARPHQQRVFK